MINAVKITCQHCGTLCPSTDPYGGFCCAGCRGVHRLIHESGLENFYELQDRAGKPVGDGPTRADQNLAAEALQEGARPVPGGFRSSLYVRGMTCRGCAWLIERLAADVPGLLGVRVSLVASRLDLVWSLGFDPAVLQSRLRPFGYGLSRAVLPGVSLSPLSLRALLSLLFSLNGLVLLMLPILLSGLEELARLIQLLALANAVFLLLIGGGVFLRPAWDALRLGHGHSDQLPGALVLLLFLPALWELLADPARLIWVPAYLMLLPALVISRLLADRLLMMRERDQSMNRTS